VRRGRRRQMCIRDRRGALSLALDRADGSSALLAAGRPGVRGRVADHVQVSPGFEAAVAAALGSVVDSVLADDSASAFDAIEHATVGELGRVEVVVAEPERRLTTLDVALPPGAVSAVSVVTAPPGVLGLLASTVVADDLDVARATRAALAAHPVPVTVITRSGEVLTDYVLRGGSGAERSRLELVAERDAAAAVSYTHLRAHETASQISYAVFCLQKHTTSATSRPPRRGTRQPTRQGSTPAAA
ncbi:chromosome segregation protein SMC, partial [Frigoribacterium faeni]|nr:chromosome segregation protein SMC [Frigoribacterium faeni]